MIENLIKKAKEIIKNKQIKFIGKSDNLGVEKPL